MPTSITVAPGLIHAALTICGRPTAATRISARRQIAAASRLFECTVVTVQSAAKKQGRQRLSDKIRSAQDDRLGAREIGMHRAQQGQAALRRARHQTRKARPQPPDIERVKAVDVFGGVDGGNDAAGIEVPRQRQLNEYPIDPVIAR